VTEERDILKEVAAYFASESKRSTFIKSRLRKYSVLTMCRMLEIESSGFYAWLRQPESKRAIEDKRLLGQIKQFWIESGFAYGYRNITKDMKDAGETCGHNRVHRIMKAAGIRSQRGYKRKRYTIRIFLFFSSFVRQENISPIPAASSIACVQPKPSPRPRSEDPCTTIK